MEGKVRIKGLKEAVDNLGKVFPKDFKAQRRILNATIRQGGKHTIVADAKQRALGGDGSGALSQSIGMRAIPPNELKRSRKVAGITIATLRYDRKAIAMYAAFYYPNGVSLNTIAGGLRHGHLVEFGHRTKGGGHVAAQPFMWPALEGQFGAYQQRFVGDLKKKIEAGIRRRARKAAK